MKRYSQILKHRQARTYSQAHNLFVPSFDSIKYKNNNSIYFSIFTFFKNKLKKCFYVAKSNAGLYSRYIEEDFATAPITYVDKSNVTICPFRYLFH